MESVYLTHEGLRKLKEELNRLANIVRPKVTASLAEARSKGDLSENAEYDAAREELAKVDRQIVDLQQKITHVHLIDENDIDHREIRVLSEVKLLNLKTNKEIGYTLVDPLQADPMKHLISIKSPIGHGLLGKKVGDEVEIDIPAGKLQLKVMEISRSEGL